MPKHTLLILSCFYSSLLFAEQTMGVNNVEQKAVANAEVDLNSGSIQLNNGKQTDNELHSKQFIPPFIDSQASNLERQIQIKNTEQAKLSNEPEALKANRTPDFVYENETFLKRITHALRIHSAPLAKAIGFLKGPPANAGATSTNVGKWRTADKVEYGLNFDGSGLVYFSVPGTSGFSGRESANRRFPFNKRTPVFSNEGKVLITNYTKKAIMEHIINKAGIVEANHISIMDNRVVFDVKEPNVRYSNATNSVVNEIKNTSAQNAENLLGTVWQPRKMGRNNWGY